MKGKSPERRKNEGTYQDSAGLDGLLDHGFLVVGGRLVRAKRGRGETFSPFFSGGVVELGAGARWSGESGDDDGIWAGVLGKWGVVGV